MMPMLEQGKIIKGIAGFYYVHVAEQGIYECKAKGIFRNQKKKPLVGDDVQIRILDPEAAVGNIEELLPRRNQLIRPASANIDQAMIIFATVSPAPNFNLLDKFLVMMEYQQVPAIVCFNKTDQTEDAELVRLEEMYRNAGCRVLFTSMRQKRGIRELKEALQDKTTVLAGPSGVGKSTLTNLLLPEQVMETGGVSRIGRGRHTTRHAELFHVSGKTYIMDTPGFTSFSLPPVEKEELRYYFPEFTDYEGTCRFHGCVHIHEPGCSVKKALEEGRISPCRYESYTAMYEELASRRKYS